MAEESGAMVLTRKDITPKIMRYGTYIFTLDPGEELKIERENGVEPDILRFRCPDHTHRVDIRITIDCDLT